MQATFTVLMLYVYVTNNIICKWPGLCYKRLYFKPIIITITVVATSMSHNNLLWKSAVLYHDAHTDGKWKNDDVEIGRCLSRKVDTQCSSSAEV